MSLEEHKSLSRRQLEMWNDGNQDDPEQLFTADYVNHQESDVEGAGPRDIDGFRSMVRNYHDAFSDSRVKVLAQVAEGDYVMTRWEVTATNSGDYPNVTPATHREISWTGVLTDRFEHGKIAETWVEWDEYGFLRRLGVIA